MLHTFGSHFATLLSSSSAFFSSPALRQDEGHKTTATLFPCPHPVYGKGVLVQGTLWGNLILGPTARDTMVKNEQTGKYETNLQVANESRDNIMGYILSKCRNLIPSFDASRVIHTFSGARAKNTLGDWIIGPVKNVPGFINAASIDSPGIAASPAIAADVVRMLVASGMISSPDPLFNPIRAPIVAPKNGPYLAGVVGANGKKKTLKYDKDNTGTIYHVFFSTRTTLVRNILPTIQYILVIGCNMH